MPPLNHSKLLDYFQQDDGIFTLFIKLSNGEIIKSYLTDYITLGDIPVRPVSTSDELRSFLSGIDGKLVTSEGEVDISKLTDEITSDMVMAEILNLMGTDHDTLFESTKWRKREYVMSRQLWIMFRRLGMGLSLQESADIFGMDHASTIHAIKTISNLRKTDKTFNSRSAKLMEMISTFAEQHQNQKKMNLTIDDLDRDELIKYIKILEDQADLMIEKIDELEDLIHDLQMER